MILTSVCRLEKYKEFEVIVNIDYDEENEFDEGELSFNHVVTGSKCNMVDLVLQGWSEVEEEDNQKWETLINNMQNDSDLKQKIFDGIKLIEY